MLRKELFEPTVEGEARVLVLIAAFTTGRKSLEGRTKLAKLDFLLRYPAYLRRALHLKAPEDEDKVAPAHDIETRMVRYRYGPWDPAYFGILGRLVGKGLVEAVPGKMGLSYRATRQGAELAARLADEPSWEDVTASAKLLRKHFDWTGSHLKKYVYETFPEVTTAAWGDEL